MSQKPRHLAATFVVGAASLPAMALAQDAARPTQAQTAQSAPPSNAIPPSGGIEWFVAGVIVGVVGTLAVARLRRKGKPDES